MSVLDFLATPRAFGNPRQIWDAQDNPVVHSRSRLVKLINQNNDGNHDVFVSHNRLLNFVNHNPFQIEVSKLFFDFDSKLPLPSDAFEDVQRVIDYLDEMQLPFLVDFSGAKGFHIFVPLKEKIYTSGQYLTDLTRSCMLFLRREFGLKTIDPKVANPTKLCRVPYSIHPKTGLHCSPLNPEWMRTWEIEKIVKYAESPNGWRSDLLDGKKHLNLEEFTEYCGIEVEEEIVVAREQFALSTENLEFTDPEDAFLAQLLHYPCLVNSILGVENAVHYARFAATIQLKRLGYTPAFIFKFFKQRRYLDVEYENECRYQINNIYNSAYTFPTCKRLQEEGLCVGKSCQYFR
jgi:hypothetical protein